MNIWTKIVTLVSVIILLAGMLTRAEARMSPARRYDIRRDERVIPGELGRLRWLRVRYRRQVNRGHWLAARHTRQRMWLLRARIRAQRRDLRSDLGR